MARKKKGGDHGGGGHGWFVTFADLMGLLVAFFVMLVAFSTQDSAKLQVLRVQCAMPSVCRTTSAIPASSRSTGCRRGRG
jgi:flagellar motor protein MotB